MKKFLILGVAIIAMACSSNNDDKKVVCENHLWNLTSSPTGYLATFGPTSSTAGTIAVNQATYEYYTAKGNVNDGSVCWEGTKN